MVGRTWTHYAKRAAVPFERKEPTLSAEVEGSVVEIVTREPQNQDSGVM